MRPAATFVNCVHTVKITQYFMQLGRPISLSDIFPCAARELVRDNGCDPNL
jgi:hypothetical protein